MTAGQPFQPDGDVGVLSLPHTRPFLKLGYGAALSLILAFIILIFTITQMDLTRGGEGGGRQ